MIALHAVRKHLAVPGGDGFDLGPLDLAFPAGRRVGILGPPGSGKSTLMRLLSGRLLPDAGRVERRGRVSPLLGAAGMLDLRLDGRRNAQGAARLYGLAPAAVLARVEAFADVGGFLARPVRALSGGQRSRLALAIALALDCDILLADGAPESGDAGLRAACRQAVLAACAAGAGLVLATASPGVLRAYGDLAVVLAGGRLSPCASLGEAVQRALPRDGHTG